MKFLYSLILILVFSNVKVEANNDATCPKYSLPKTVTVFHGHVDSYRQNLTDYATELNAATVALLLFNAVIDLDEILKPRDSIRFMVGTYEPFAFAHPGTIRSKKGILTPGGALGSEKEILTPEVAFGKNCENQTLEVAPGSEFQSKTIEGADKESFTVLGPLYSVLAETARKRNKSLEGISLTRQDKVTA